MLAIMGAYCYLHLSFDVEPRQVADVMAVSLGARAKMLSFDHEKDESSKFLYVSGQPGIRPVRSSMSGALEIDIGDDAKDWLEQHFPDEAVTFTPTMNPHVQSDGKIWYQVTLLSRPLEIALAARVASWFGGTVRPNSYRETEELVFGRACPTDKRGDIPCRGRPLEEYLAALSEMHALSDEEIQRYRHAAGRA